MVSFDRKVKRMMLEGVEDIAPENERLPLVSKQLAPFREAVGGFDKYDRPTHPLIDKMYKLHDEMDTDTGLRDPNRYFILRFDKRVKRLYQMVKESMSKFDIKKMGKEQAHFKKMMAGAEKKIKDAQRGVTVGSNMKETAADLDQALSYLHECIDLFAHFFGQH